MQKSTAGSAWEVRPEFRSRLFRLIGIILGACSGALAVPIASLAIIFLNGIFWRGPVGLFAAGVVLVLVFLLHIVPVSWIGNKRRLLIYATFSVGLAFLFGLLYFLAERSDPFRSEGELWAHHPFRLAMLLAVLPPLRALARWQVGADSTNAALSA